MNVTIAVCTVLYFVIIQVARLNIENSELRTKLEEHKQDLLSINVTLEQRKLKVYIVLI